LFPKNIFTHTVREENQQNEDNEKMADPVPGNPYWCPNRLTRLTHPKECSAVAHVKRSENCDAMLEDLSAAINPAYLGSLAV
jgi:hypothetical protein